MCIYTNTRYSCGHFHQGTSIGTGSVVCTKCVPVKVALEYWHRQLKYLPIEAPTGTTMSCPRACRQVRPLPRGFTGNRTEWQADDATLRANMLFHGVDAAEASRIVAIETTPGVDSTHGLARHTKPVEDYPQNWYNFIRDLEVYQSRPSKAPNVRIINAIKGCGCPVHRTFPNPCLVGWTGTDILMLRMREWNMPPRTRFLTIDYGAHIQHNPSRDPGTAPASTICTVPISESLHRVLLDLGRSTQGPAVSGGNAPPQELPEHSEESSQKQPRTQRRASSVPAVVKRSPSSDSAQDNLAKTLEMTRLRDPHEGEASRPHVDEPTSGPSEGTVEQVTNIV